MELLLSLAHLPEIINITDTVFPVSAYFLFTILNYFTIFTAKCLWSDMCQKYRSIETEPTWNNYSSHLFCILFLKSQRCLNYVFFHFRKESQSITSHSVCGWNPRCNMNRFKGISAWRWERFFDHWFINQFLEGKTPTCWENAFRIPPLGGLPSHVLRPIFTLNVPSLENVLYFFWHSLLKSTEKSVCAWGWAFDLKKWNSRSREIITFQVNVILQSAAPPSSRFNWVSSSIQCD